MPTPAVDPVYFDPLNLPTFTVFDDAGMLLATLPPTLRLTNEFGTPDPYTYDRAPGSPVWRRFGDGLPREYRPLVGEGDYIYDTREEGLAAVNLFQSITTSARMLRWVGADFLPLDAAYPMAYTWRFGEYAQRITHRFTFNGVSDAILPDPSTPLPPGSGGLYWKELSWP